MLAELGGVSKIIIAVGYTDYPRRIIIREIFGIY